MTTIPRPEYPRPQFARKDWLCLNESWQLVEDSITMLDDVTRGLFLAAKAMDATRPVLDASGYSHRVPETDFFDRRLKFDLERLRRIQSRPAAIEREPNG